MGTATTEGAPRLRSEQNRLGYLLRKIATLSIGCKQDLGSHNMMFKVSKARPPIHWYSGNQGQVRVQDESQVPGCNAKMVQTLALLGKYFESRALGSRDKHSANKGKNRRSRQRNRRYKGELKNVAELDGTSPEMTGPASQKTR